MARILKEDQYNLEQVEDVGNADYQERYLKPIGRSLVVFEGERICKAVVKLEP